MSYCIFSIEKIKYVTFKYLGEILRQVLEFSQSLLNFNNLLELEAKKKYYF